MTCLNTYHQFLFLATCVVTASAASQYFDLSPSKNLTVARGSSLTIPCKVRNRMGECMWMHDGKSIGIIRYKYDFRRSPDNGDCGLTIYNVSLDGDNGNWQCQVTSVAVGQQTLQSETINLLVLISPERPNIRRTHPYTPELQVLVNQDNAIECSVANGNPAPKITWLLNGKNITDHAETTISRNPKTLAFTAMSKLSDYRIQRQENRFNLTCYSEHPTNNQADSVILNVLYPPIVNVSKSRYSIMEGVDLRVECIVDANPKANVLWKRIGSSGAVQTSGRTEPHILSFERVTRDLDASLFECQAQNEYGVSEPALISLDVLYTPRLLNTSSAQSVMTGGPATLYCNYEGNPRPTVKWFYINPRTADTTAISNESKDQSILHIENTTYSHEGEYFCEATNQINTIDYVVRSSNIVLDVYGLPAFLTKSPSPSQGRKGDQSEVSLWFCADPPPNNVYWKFGSIHLDAIKKANLSVPTRYVVRPIMPLTTKRGPETSHCYDSTLLIRDTDFSDERDYVLVIENERGVNEGVVQLRVVTPLSATTLIAIALSIIFVIFIISIVTLLMVRKARRKGNGSIRDEEEAKEDAAALSQTPVSKNKSGDSDHKGGTGREKHELVYANLDFEKGQPVNGAGAGAGAGAPAARVKPVPKPKPQVAQRHHNSHNNHSRPANSTEYAQIAFSNKIDL